MERVTFKIQQKKERPKQDTTQDVGQITTEIERLNRKLDAIDRQTYKNERDLARQVEYKEEIAGLRKQLRTNNRGYATFTEVPIATTLEAVEKPLQITDARRTEIEADTESTTNVSLTKEEINALLRPEEPIEKITTNETITPHLNLDQTPQPKENETVKVGKPFENVKAEAITEVETKNIEQTLQDARSYLQKMEERKANGTITPQDEARVRQLRDQISLLRGTRVEKIAEPAESPIDIGENIQQSTVAELEKERLDKLSAGIEKFEADGLAHKQGELSPETKETMVEKIRAAVKAGEAAQTNTEQATQPKPQSMEEEVLRRREDIEYTSRSEEKNALMEKVRMAVAKAGETMRTKTEASASPENLAWIKGVYEKYNKLKWYKKVGIGLGLSAVGASASLAGGYATALGAFLYGTAATGGFIMRGLGGYALLDAAAGKKVRAMEDEHKRMAARGKMIGAAAIYSILVPQLFSAVDEGLGITEKLGRGAAWIGEHIFGKTAETAAVTVPMPGVAHAVPPAAPEAAAIGKAALHAPTAPPPLEDEDVLAHPFGHNAPPVKPHIVHAIPKPKAPAWMPKYMTDTYKNPAGIHQPQDQFTTHMPSIPSTPGQYVGPGQIVHPGPPAPPGQLVGLGGGTYMQGEQPGIPGATGTIPLGNGNIARVNVNILPGIHKFFSHVPTPEHIASATTGIDTWTSTTSTNEQPMPGLVNRPSVFSAAPESSYAPGVVQKADVPPLQS